jgi:hypothetical protein
MFALNKLSLGVSRKRRSPLVRLRNFLGFDPVLNSYGSFTTWTVTGNLEISVDFSTTSSDGLQTLFGLDGGADFFVRLTNINTSPTLSLREAGTDYSFSLAGLTPDGKFRNLKLIRTGSTWQVYLDGVPKGSKTEAAWGSTISINLIGMLGNGAQFFNGVLANNKFTDLVTDSNSQAYDLDQATGTTESSTINTGTLTYNNIPEANRFQAQLIGADWVGTIERNINGNFATNSDWTLSANATISGGLLNFGSGTVTATQEILTVGAVYKLEYDVDTFVGAEVGASSASFTSALYASGTGITEGIRTASSADFTLVSTTDGNKISSSSAKRILEAP